MNYFCEDRTAMCSQLYRAIDCALFNRKISNVTYNIQFGKAQDNYVPEKNTIVFCGRGVEDEKLDMSNIEFISEGYRRVTAIEQYLREINGNNYINVYAKPSSQNVVIVYDASLSIIELQRSVASIIIFLLPTLYKNTTDKIKQSESSFFASVLKRKMTEFNYNVQNVLKSSSAIRFSLKKNIGKARKKSVNANIERLTNSLNSTRDSLNYFNEQYNTALAMINDLNDQIVAQKIILDKTQEDDSTLDFIDFFDQCDKLDLNKIDPNGAIYYTAKTYIDNFDTEKFEAYVKSRGYTGVYDLITPRGTNFNYDQMIDFMRSIFGQNPIARIRVYAKYKLDVINKTVSGISSSDSNFEDSSCNELYPNPHIAHYSCLGAYNSIFRRNMEDMDIISVLNTSIASAGSINVGQLSTMRYFGTDLFDLYRDRNFIQIIETGELMTPAQYIKYLIDKKNNPVEQTVVQTSVTEPEVEMNIGWEEEPDWNALTA